jgi:arsenite/tail-anchored protein-transporting ATPase
MDSSLKELVDNETMKWVFVGGKGGVGKTTTSCCLGVQLAKKRKSVLIVSTDPAHNLSDAFGQKFSRTPTLVEGFDNLYCMEIDAAAAIEEESALVDAAQAEQEGIEGPSEAASTNKAISSFMKEMGNSIPGIDEAMSFMELLKHMKRMEFDVTVFDTAPTGHTLRLLALPGTLDRALQKVIGLRDRFGGMLSAVQGMFGGPGGAAAGMPPVDQMFAKVDEIRG